MYILQTTNLLARMTVLPEALNAAVVELHTAYRKYLQVKCLFNDLIN